VSQTERIFFIDRTIRERHGITVAEITTRYEVCDRQAKRDIEYMKDRLSAPIAWSAARRRYEYARPWDALSFADERSFFAFAFLRSILTDYQYIPVISDDILETLKDRIVGAYARIADRVEYELSDFEPIRGETAYVICRAMLADSRVRIKYVDSKGEESERSISPARLVNYSGKWYCVARDSKSSELRTFALSRIKAAVRTDESATDLPARSEIETFLLSSYGIFKGKPLGTAVLRFTGGAARAVRDQVWHRDQTIRNLPETDGEPSIELSLPAHDWTELLGRALRCGSQCEVMGPEDFRERWREEIGRMAEMAGRKE
jgi:predicted DNA-binding transcriptional regulator YafY